MLPITAVALFRQSDLFAFSIRQWPTPQWAFILTTYAFVSVWIVVVSGLPALLSHLQHTYPVWMYIYLYTFIYIWYDLCHIDGWRLHNSGKRCDVIAEPSDLLYSGNRSVCSSEPWGTPVSTKQRSDTVPLHKSEPVCGYLASNDIFSSHRSSPRLATDTGSGVVWTREITFTYLHKMRYNPSNSR